MSDKIIYDFVFTGEKIESRGYKKAVKSFQSKFPNYKEVLIKWFKNGAEHSKVQKLPLGRKKKVNRWLIYY